MVITCNLMTKIRIFKCMVLHKQTINEIKCTPLFCLKCEETLSFGVSHSFHWKANLQTEFHQLISTCGFQILLLNQTKTTVCKTFFFNLLWPMKFVSFDTCAMESSFILAK